MTPGDPLGLRDAPGSSELSRASHVNHGAGGGTSDRFRLAMPVGQRTHGSASLQVRISLALPKRLRAHTREITKVHTPASMQGNGLASALMREVCAEADEAGMTLMLWPRPYGDDVALSASMLCDWYAGFGFRVIQPEPVLMARAPGLYTRLAPVTAACEAMHG
jgi:predicted GNAT family acetyltransferase